MSKAFILMVIIVSCAVIAREVSLRVGGSPTAYDDGAALWSHKRAKIYLPKEKSTVFIGTSRMNYDLDVQTWRQLTGDEPVQLAIAGTGPMNVLINLADDEKFKGRLIIDGMEEGLLFPDNGVPITNINYYKNITPAQKASFEINQLLESVFVSLDKDNFSLSAELSKIQIPSRQGVWSPPVFPEEFTWSNIDRQHFMTEEFVNDTSLQNKVRAIWNLHHNFFRDTVPSTERGTDSVYQVIKHAVNKITSRGGEVLFVKLPCSGPYLMSETRDFPRERFWDRMLVTTQCQGIHFQDYPIMAHLTCPEWSHLSQPDAAIYTTELIRILYKEKHWSFTRLHATGH